MFYFLFVEDYEKLKIDYIKEKMEQMNKIQALEKQFEYYKQFFEPTIEMKVSNDNFVVAQTQINHLDNTQPDFIQICVGILLDDRSNYADLKIKANELIKKELLNIYPKMSN